MLVVVATRCSRIFVRLRLVFFLLFLIGESVAELVEPDLVLLFVYPILLMTIVGIAIVDPDAKSMAIPFARHRADESGRGSTRP